MTAGEKRRAYTGPAFLSHGFRPFFFLGACFAALAIPLWLAAFTHGYGVGGDAMRWHVHEMLFGYLAAIVAGFLMTAIPNWTGRLPVMGLPLFLFVFTWIAGRIAMASGDGILVATADNAASQGETHEYDLIACTIPLDDFVPVADATENEIEVARSIRWNGYTTTLVAVEDWFDDVTVQAYSAAVLPGSPYGRMMSAYIHSDQRISRRGLREEA